MIKEHPDKEQLRRHKDAVTAAKQERNEWLPMWRQLNEAFFPYIYGGLLDGQKRSGGRIRNKKLIDGAPAIALGVLAAGFMNGVTSPARKWLKVKRPGAQAYQDPDAGASETHNEIRKKILETLAGTNYYDSRAMQVLDGCGLGTGVLLCYEDRDAICKFTLCPPGTYMLLTDASNTITGFIREFKLKATDMLAEFGESALPSDIVERAKKGGAQGRTEYLVTHLIEENADDGFISARTPFRESYWLSAPNSKAPPYLAKRPLYEWPVAVMRWACPDEATYGVPPTLAVYGKAVQLQNLELKSDQGLDKMISPPLLADAALKSRPKAFGANGITFTNNLSQNSGARPLYQMNIPFQEMDIKRGRIDQAIKDGLHNHLFDMISQLDTVRSATEIDARREEKLVQLGPVLHRSYIEDLSVVVKRVYGILRRKQLVPEVPPGEGAEIEFSNILSDVQKASDVSVIERFFAFVGNSVIPVFPQAQTKINAMELLTQYAEGLGIAPNSLNSNDDAAAAQEPQNEMAMLEQMSGIAKNFGGAAQGLANAGVGGGMDAVQAML